MAAPSSFCWGAHDPPTPKALRTLATHIVAYPWNATSLPLREWGNTVLYLGLEGRTSSNLSHRQAALQRFLSSLARSGHRYGVHVDLGDASVPWWSLTPDATTAAARSAPPPADVQLPPHLAYVLAVNMAARCSRCYGWPLGPTRKFALARRRGELQQLPPPGRAAAPLLSVSRLKFHQEPKRLSVLADLVFGWEYYGKPDWVMWAHAAPRRNATAPSEESAGRGRLLRKGARNLLRRMRRDAPGGLAGLAKRQPAAESAANNTSRLGVVRYAEQLRAAPFTLSPEGRGVDCYRHWEALLMGTLPVVEPSATVAHFRGAHSLPMVPLPRCDELLAGEASSQAWVLAQCNATAINTTHRRKWRGLEPSEHYALPPEAWWRELLRTHEPRCSEVGALDESYWAGHVRRLKAEHGLDGGGSSA